MNDVQYKALVSNAVKELSAHMSRSVATATQVSKASRKEKQREIISQLKADVQATRNSIDRNFHTLIKTQKGVELSSDIPKRLECFICTMEAATSVNSSDDGSIFNGAYQSYKELKNQFFQCLEAGVL